MRCEECDKESNEEDVCTNCGLVFQDRPIDYAPRINAKNQVTSHRIFRSVFLTSLEDSTKVNIDECKNADLKRALQKHYQPWSVRREHAIRKEIKRICRLLVMSKDFLISCMYLFNKVSKFDKKCKKKLFKGGGSVSLEIAAQGIVYLQTRLQKLPFSFYDLEFIGCDKKLVSKFYSRLVKEMCIKIKPQRPEDFVYRIVNKLGLEERKKNLLFFECKNLAEKITGDKSAIINAGACIYILGSKRHRITQKNICDVIGCNHQTLRTRIKAIRNENL